MHHTTAESMPALRHQEEDLRLKAVEFFANLDELGTHRPILEGDDEREMDELRDEILLDRRRDWTSLTPDQIRSAFKLYKTDSSLREAVKVEVERRDQERGRPSQPLRSIH